MAALTIAALLLRLPGLNGGLWVDEIYSLLFSFRLPVLDIVAAFPRDNHHPFYSLLAHAARALFGEAPWTVRLPSLLFGTATVPALFVLARDVAGRRVGFIAAALLAASWHHAWFSQNARGYAMLAFFAVLGTWLLLRGVATGRRAWFIGYAIAGALGAWTHLTMVFVVAGQAAGCIVWAFSQPAGNRWSQLKGPAIGVALAGLLTVALYAAVLLQVGDYFVNRPSQLRGVSTPLWALLEAARVLMVGVGGARGAVAVVILALGVTIFVAGLVRVHRHSPLALLLFVTPGVAIVLGALAARGTMYPRFFFALAGFAVIIVVCGVVALAEGVARGRPAVARGLVTAFAVLAVGANLFSAARTFGIPKQDFGGAVSFAAAQEGRGDLVATAGAASLPAEELFGRSWPRTDSLPPLDSLRRLGRPVWLVYTFPRYLERFSPDVFAAVLAECRDAATFRGTVGGGDVTVCAFPPRAAGGEGR